jgi:hypothetical protein
VPDAELVALHCKPLRVSFIQHRVDSSVPIEDVAGAVSELIADGKVYSDRRNSPTDLGHLFSALRHLPGRPLLSGGGIGLASRRR